MDPRNPVPAEVTGEGRLPEGQEPASTEGAEIHLPAEVTGEGRLPEGQEPASSEGAEIHLPAEVTGEGRLPEGQTTAKSKWAERLRRYKFSLFFILVGAGFGVAAVFLLPSHEPINAPASFRIVEISSSRQIKAIDMEVSGSDNVHFLLINLLVEPSRNTKNGHLITAELDLPPGTSVQPCHRPDCHRMRGYGEIAYLHATVKNRGLPTATLRTAVVGPFAFDANGVIAEAQLPSVNFSSISVKSATISYKIPGAAAYDWSGAPTAPYYVSANFIGWPISSVNSENPIPITGTDHNAETHDNTLIFVAGIFLGTAGAALIAGCQEGFTAFADRPRGPAGGSRRRTIRARDKTRERSAARPGLGPGH